MKSGCAEAIAAGQAGNDVNAAVVVSGTQAVGDVFRSRGAGHIGRLEPSRWLEPTMPHSTAGNASDALSIPGSVREVEDGRRSGRRTRPRRGRCGDSSSSAVVIAQEQTQVGRAPVSGNEPCRAHQCDSRSTVLPLAPVRKSRSQPRSACMHMLHIQTGSSRGNISVADDCVCQAAAAQRPAPRP